MNEQEAERIRQVYAGYRDDADVQRRRAGTNPGNQAILAERQDVLRQSLEAGGWLPLAGRRVLDVGCGGGDVLAGLTAWGATPEDLFGVDLLPERLAAARAKHPAIRFTQANAEALPFPDASFDLVLVFTVFSSIRAPETARRVAAEVGRVLRPGGAVVWYDFRFNNPQNQNVQGISRRDVEALFPGFAPRLRTVTLLPPLARRLGKATGMLYTIFSFLPMLRTHYLGLLTKTV